MTLVHTADNCGGELGRDSQYFTALVDDGGHAGVGGTQHVTSGLERARLRNLQMLLRRDRTVEPRHVADVNEQRGLRQLTDDFLSERVFVTDVDGDSLTGDG